MGGESCLRVLDVGRSEPVGERLLSLSEQLSRELCLAPPEIPRLPDLPPAIPRVPSPRMSLSEQLSQEVSLPPFSSILILPPQQQPHSSNSNNLVSES